MIAPWRGGQAAFKSPRLGEGELGILVPLTVLSAEFECKYIAM